MKISVESTQYGEYVNNSYIKKHKSENDFTNIISTASQQTTKQEDGDVLGITMLKEPGTNRFWGMKAKYASCSTQDNPVIYVETNYGGKTVSYNVNINEVDPNKASRLEMFALCSYADDRGIGDNSTFGTYNTLRSFEEMAKYNKYINSQTQELNALNQFKNEKLDWINISEKVTDLLYKCKDLVQYRKGLKIMDMFTKQLVK